MKSKKIPSGSISKPIKKKKNDNLQGAQEWQSIFNTINAAIWILNKKQRIIMSNKTAEIYFKRKLDEIIGKQCWEVAHGTAEPLPECPILSARISLKRETTQLRIGKRWYRVTVDPILDSEGKFAGAVHIITDVTDQKLTEEQLIASRDFAENLIRTANTMIIGLNIKGDIIVFNKAAEMITGYKRAELECRNWFETLVPKDRYPEVWEEFNRLKKGEIPVEFENPILTKSGEERFIIWKNNVIREKDKITGTISFGLDITDRKNIEESLKIERSQLFSIFDGIKEPIYVADMDNWEVLFVNHSLRTMLGKNPVGGKCYRELQGFESQCPFCTNHIIKKSKPESYRWEHYNPIINRTFDLHDKVIKWPDGRDVRLELAIDITERKQAEIRLNKLNRTYALLSNVNQMIVRVKDSLELFNEACRIAVEQGGFRMVWIGLLDPSTKRVNPVAHAGITNGYLKKIDIKLDNSDRGKGPTASALKNGKYVVINDIATDPGMASWRDDALKLGYRSFAVFPIIVSGEARGTLNMYAPDQGFFDDQEEKLLEEMTSDIAFSLEFFEHEEKRKQAEKELQKYHEHLEELVKERTIKLEKANLELESEINERKKIEEQLAKERNMLKTLIDNIPDEIYAKDRESRFIMANSNVIKSLWKNSLHEIINKTDFDLLPHDQASGYFNDEQSLMSSDKQLVNYETSKYDNNGALRWYSITKVPLKDNENKTTGLVGINRDITMFKLAEESYKRAKEAAEAANIAKSTFLSSMSHEIRTPLNAVLGFSQLMLNDDNLTPDQKDYLETINRSGEHLLNLINDILEISKIEAGRAAFNPTIFNLHSLINDIETMFRIKADSKKLSFLVEYPGDLPKFIVTDEGKLRQILINIIGNALKFTEEGGIAVRIRADDVENGKAILIMEVEDTGPGIAEKDIQKLFQLFGQTESGLREGGTGLGLVISREYARIMGGDITVKTEIGSGSCFTIIIMIEKNKEALPIKKARKKRVVGIEPGQNYKVLIVDDQTDNRLLLNKILTSVGFEVNQAADGLEAVEKFKSWSPDIVIMDMRMPVMDGYEATSKIKSMDEKIPIIAVTASAFYEDRVKAIEAGADKYLRKPFKREELLEQIKTHLDVKYVYNEE